MDQTLQSLLYNGTNHKCLPLQSSLPFLLDELAFSFQCKKDEIWTTCFKTLILSHFDLDFHSSCTVLREKIQATYFFYQFYGRILVRNHQLELCLFNMRDKHLEKKKFFVFL